MVHAIFDLRFSIWDFGCMSALRPAIRRHPYYTIAIGGSSESARQNLKSCFCFGHGAVYNNAMTLNLEILSRAANEARGLCMDAVQASQSGHLGLPLGCAEMGAVLYGYALKHNPEKPRWIGRDYFVLSAGHGSMFLYAWLHMRGHNWPAWARRWQCCRNRRGGKNGGRPF